MELFDYKEFTNRNIGFVTEEEQDIIKSTQVFVCGVGGMGGACANSLIRMGVSNIAIADIDKFEVSNLNRQLFANLDTVNKSKVYTTKEQLLKINPELKITCYEEEWVDNIDKIFEKHKIVINGTDDTLATLLMYRKSAEHNCTVIDAYASPLPSVYVVKPNDPRPEERLNFPTTGKILSTVTNDDIDECVLREVEYVMTNSSSVKHIDLDIAAEFIAGKRSRMSLAPMVITAGNMMAYEALFTILGKRSGADDRGYFWNPEKGKIERPRNIISALIIRFIVKRFLRKLLTNV